MLVAFIYLLVTQFRFTRRPRRSEESSVPLKEIEGTSATEGQLPPKPIINDKVEQTKVHIIDRLARVVMPIIFVLFNIVYFCVFAL